ncbi:MAG: ABC transporter permease [Myxococcaceae bacterium]|nr:ABC transporter permease [Myxococcaceae bacterium]MBH2005988.1 ABC transporter permease [Myxococcaceae bacterium]
MKSWSDQTIFYGFTLLLLAVLGMPELIGDSGLTLDLDLDLAPGYGENGFSVFTWLIFGARLSLFVALTGTMLSLSLGVFYGLMAGYWGGKVDAVMMRLIDVLQAFPGILLALYIAALLKPGIANLIFALCATGWVGYARVARAQVLTIKNREFILAASALGATHKRILFGHILPNIWGPLWVQASFGISSLILAEASLSFLGLGVPPGTPSWGALLEQGVTYLLVAPHLVIAPGICIASAVLLFNFLGDWLRDRYEH